MNQIKVELQEYMGSDRSIAEAAWTSSTLNENKSTKTNEQVESLVKRLANDGHSTPFESVVLRFWIKMPIQTDRQHMSHRIASHNGMSGRYRTMPSEFLDVPEDIKNILGHSNNEDIKVYNQLCKQANDFYIRFLEQYKNAEKNGIITNNEYKRLREFFRGVLPQNNMTERITIMNLRSFANYYRLRSSNHAQPEIQEIARQMLEAVKKSNVCPIALKALEENNWKI